MRLSFILITVLLLFASATQQQDGSRKLALIIAIGTYDSTTGWKTISSLNDINYMKPALMGQGFEENNIDVLKNEQATKAGIEAAIDRLIAKAKANDIVVFHFSGHGQQLFDDANKDEADGYDEALVPYDAKMHYGGGYTGQNHLRDDELGIKLKLLRKKIGKQGSLLVLLDACHSGTATRGQEFSATRGSDEKCEPIGYSKTISPSRGGGSESIVDDKELLSNMVVISAASADQLNYETKDAEKNGVGSLSYAFSQAISQTSGAINYKILFEKIKTAIQSWKSFQNPQIEGNTEQQVLGGKYIKTSEIVRISSWNPDKSIEIPRGAIHSIIKGAKFNLYPVDIVDFKNTKPIASGEVIEAGMVKSTGQFSSAIPDKTKAYNIVFETKNDGERSIGIRLSIPETSIATMIRDKFNQYEYVSFEKNTAD
ncbi:MAG: caspase domain-containing protein, partial [Chitinophagaceae bacterium]